MENSNDIWQTEINGQIYETDLDGLVQWIAEGSLLPQDKVRRGNLRWLEANKVPALHKFFNAQENGATPPTVSTNNLQAGQEIVQTQNFSAHSLNRFSPQEQAFNEPPPPQFYQEIGETKPANFCVLHAETKADYFCETCSNYFCRDCPAQNICPMCGALCKALDAPAIPQPELNNSLNHLPRNNSEAPEVKPEEIGKGANWLHWKAGMTVVNAILMLTGINLTFYLGLGITQILQSVAIAIAQESEAKGITAIQGVAFIISLFCAGFLVFLGIQAGRGKKWAFILGLIIYALDGILYLLITISSFSYLAYFVKSLVFGVLLHALAIYSLVNGMRAIRKT